MQRIDRRVEVAVFLLQSCELGLEFALIFVSHGLLKSKTRMRFAKSSSKLGASIRGSYHLGPSVDLAIRLGSAANVGTAH
jgi:hypothetical protein